MFCRGTSRRYQQRRWVTLRGGSCCRRIDKNAFHLPNSLGGFLSASSWGFNHREHSVSRLSAQGVASGEEWAGAKLRRGATERDSRGAAADLGVKEGGGTDRVERSAAREREPVGLISLDDENSRRLTNEETGGNGLHQGSTNPHTPMDPATLPLFHLGPATPVVALRGVVNRPTAPSFNFSGRPARGIAQQHVTGHSDFAGLYCDTPREEQRRYYGGRTTHVPLGNDYHEAVTLATTTAASPCVGGRNTEVEDSQKTQEGPFAVTAASEGKGMAANETSASLSASANPQRLDVGAANPGTALELAGNNNKRKAHAMEEQWRPNNNHERIETAQVPVPVAPSCYTYSVPCSFTPAGAADGENCSAIALPTMKFAASRTREECMNAFQGPQFFTASGTREVDCTDTCAPEATRKCLAAAGAAARQEECTDASPPLPKDEAADKEKVSAKAAATTTTTATTCTITETMQDAATEDRTDDDAQEDSQDAKYLTNEDVRFQDVLCGRGAHATHHSGNRDFRDDISQLLHQYVKSSKQGKTKLADAILQKVTKRGGRFLQRVEHNDGAAAKEEESDQSPSHEKKRCRRSTYDEDNVWEVLSYMQARRKVSQRFRQEALSTAEVGNGDVPRLGEQKS